ncbi:hypothetical protein B0H14DRAFT_456298 [Mycena olivaceomarginata]|nr:hypothetical protein B0H14DRAFT_456298 [Mycena olivaceomarginata]
MSEQPTQSKQPKQPKPNPLDRFMGRFRKTTPKASPAPSPNSSRSTTPAPSNREESSPGAAAVLSSNPESAPRGIEKGADSLKGGDTAKTDNSDAVHLPVGPTHGSSPRVDMHVYGGTGGTGGAGTGGGPGGTGEGPKFDFRDSNVTLTDPHNYNSSRRSSLAMLQHSINLQIRARVFVHLVHVWKSKQTSWSGYHYSLEPRNISSGSQYSRQRQINSLCNCC